MKYEFVHKRNSDWCFQEEKIIADLLQLLSSPPTENLLVDLSKFLANITQADFLLIGRTILPAAEEIRTVCFLTQGEVLPDIIYPLKNTPCQDALDYGVCYYPVGIQHEFPEDQDLAEMGIESYMGTAITDKEGKKIGIVVMLSQKTIANPGFIEHVLTLAAPHIEQYLLQEIAEKAC